MFTKVKNVFFTAAAAALLATGPFSGCANEPTAVDPEPVVPSDSVVIITSGNFDSLVADSGVAALVEFYSPGCPICAGMAWVIDSLSTVLGDSALIGASNTDSDTLWKRFSITTTPSYVLFRNGTEMTRRSYASPDSSALDTLAWLLRQMIAGTLMPDTADTSTQPMDTIPAGTIVLDKSNFSEMTEVAGRVSLIDFHSPLCPTCQSMDSIVANLAVRYEGRALIGKVNVLTDDTLQVAFAIQAWPTFVFLKSGTEVRRAAGVTPSATLDRILDSLVESR